MKELKSLSNSLLVENLKALTGVERETISAIVEYLHEVEKRKLYLELGYSSLFALCLGLGYSEGSAYRRIQAARCLGDNPEILEKLSDGSLSLCAVTELSRVPAHERGELIVASEGKSKIEVQKLVAAKIPLKDARPAAEKVKVTAIEARTLQTAESVPKAERRFTVTLELTEEEFSLLEEVQVITSERLRSRAIVRALKMYKKINSPAEKQKRREKRSSEKIDRKEFTATVKQPEVSVISRHIPSVIREQVIIRDGCQCTFVADGHRCTEKNGLQVDHVTPFSIGGGHELENLRLLCGSHNRYVYDRFIERSANRVST